MTLKKLIIILASVVTVVVVLLLGTSYAWYQFENAVTSFDNVQTFTDGIDDLAVVFTNDDNINTLVGVPIFASEVAEKSSKTKFSLTPSSEKLAGKDVAFQIQVVDLVIDSTLTNTADLKWSFLETVGTGSTTTIASGDFRNFTEKTLTLKPTTKISTFDVTYSYEFRIWLEDNGCTLEQINNKVCSSQNNLMGKAISGKIKILTAAR